MSQRMPKVEHFTTLDCDVTCDWDLWFVQFNTILHRFEESKLRIGEDSSLKGLKKPNNGTVMVFQPTSGALRSLLSYENPLTEPRNLKKIQPQKMPRSFLGVGEVWPHPNMNFPSFGSLGCEMKTQVLLNQVPFHKMKMIQEDQNCQGE